MSFRFKTRPTRFLLVASLFGILLVWGASITIPFEGQGKHQEAVSLSNSKSLSQSGGCEPWKKVNTNGFGLPSEFDEFNQAVKSSTEMPYQSEEGFEVLVFANQLYLGMEADNFLGARLWRTRFGVNAPQTQLDWEEVAAGRERYPFGVRDTAQADHIDSLAAFRDRIFASVANRSGSPKGTLVFRSSSGNPATWEDALTTIGPGFGKSQNENFKDMQVFDGYLCGGTWNEKDGAEVWCTPDGVDWEQKNLSGFGNPRNIIIWSGHVYNGYLYFGVQSTDEDKKESVGRLYRTHSLKNQPYWEEVFVSPAGTTWGNILGDLDGFLYISVSSPDGMIIYRSPDGEPGNWETASTPGIDNSPAHWGVVADGAVVYQNALYLGVVNGQNNFTIWRTEGAPEDPASSRVIWEQISTDEITSPNNYYVQLAAFNGRLYAWTSDPVHGQQVWSTFCGAVSEPGQ